TQDMIQRKIGKSELESLTGYILKLADKNTIKAPYNRAIYSLCKEKFRENFEPLDVKDVMVEVNKFK
ncbi:MAG: hypothetical protein GY870_06795, partial [archaeon]|nr:hypothetical protein [archaeon]